MGKTSARAGRGQRRPCCVRTATATVSCRRQPSTGVRHRARAHAGGRVRPGRTHPHRRRWSAGEGRHRGRRSAAARSRASCSAHDHEVTLIDRQPTPCGSPGRRRRLAARRRVRAPHTARGAPDEPTCVIAATGDDKANLVISLLAKTEFGVPRTVARVNNPKNEWMFDEAWGVDVAVSTPRIMTAMVEEAVTVGDLVRIFTFHQSRADILELTLPDDSPLAGVRVGQIEWPGDTVRRASSATRATPHPVPTTRRGLGRAAVHLRPRHRTRPRRNRTDPWTSVQLSHRVRAVSGRPMASFAVPGQRSRRGRGRAAPGRRAAARTSPPTAKVASAKRRRSARSRATRRRPTRMPPLDSGPPLGDRPITRPTSGHPTRISPAPRQEIHR